MSKSWSTGGGTFEQAPIGAHEAICIRIVDLGTQESEYKGEKTSRRQNLITWELPEEARDDGQPFIISKFYTASLGEKANLFKDLTSWLGKAPTVPFDPKSLLGKPCQVVVTERNEKHVVSAVVALKQKDAAKLGEPHNPLVFFSLDEFDEEVFDDLPQGIQRMVMKSPEYATALADGPVTVADEPDEEDPPF